MEGRKTRRVVVFCLVITIIIGAIDLIVPLGVAVGVLYLVPFFFLINHDNDKTIIGLAVVTSCLTVFAYLVLLGSDTSWMAAVNRGISILAIWVATSVLLILNRKNREANVYLERKNQELEQFAYIASHDLQEPLRTLISYTELLEKKYNTGIDETGQKFLRFISESSFRMRDLVTGLLDYSRIGKHAELEMVDCNLIFSSILQDMEATLVDVDGEINIGVLPVIKGYRVELRSLFLNMVSNAVKFKKEGERIVVDVSVKSNEHTWKFMIKDNGIGIQKEYFDKIFMIFKRLNPRGEFSGSGIGLAHCKKIIEMHKGQIKVDSEFGIGSTFYITIPKKIK